MSTETRDELPELPDGFHWVVERDMQKCSLCELCTKHCPTGALYPVQDDEILFIRFDPARCDGCRICLDHCPEDASDVKAVADSDDLAEVRTLVESRMLRCEVCDSLFAPVTKVGAAARRRENPDAQVELVQDQCPLCRRTQMVARFIDENRDAEGKAEYRTGKKWSWKAAIKGGENEPPCWEILDFPQDSPFHGGPEDSKDSKDPEVPER